MYRHLSRVLVALLTFAAGVIASTLFYHPVHIAKEATILLATPISKVASPTMSIESVPSAPLKLLYVGTEINLSRDEGRRVSFLLQNVSTKDISFYSVSCSKSRAGSNGIVYSEAHYTLQDFRPGTSQPFVCECDANETLRLTVNEVWFVDGGTWNKN